MTVAPDARPDTSVLRVQVLLAARSGCRSELAEALGRVAAEAARSLGSASGVVVLTEIDADPFPQANPLCRPFEAVLELQADAAVGADTLLGSIDAADEERCVDRDNSVSFCTATRVVPP